MHPRQEYHSIWHYKYSMWLDIKRLLFELFKLCASDRFAILALAAVTSHRNDTYPKGMNWHKRPVFMRRLWRQPTIVICMFRGEAYMFVIMLWVADDSRSDSTYESQQSNLFEWMEKNCIFSLLRLIFWWKSNVWMPQLLQTWIQSEIVSETGWKEYADD